MSDYQGSGNKKSKLLWGLIFGGLLLAIVFSAKEFADENAPGERVTIIGLAVEEFRINGELHQRTGAQNLYLSLPPGIHRLEYEYDGERHLLEIQVGAGNNSNRKYRFKDGELKLDK